MVFHGIIRSVWRTDCLYSVFVCGGWGRLGDTVEDGSACVTRKQVRRQLSHVKKLLRRQKVPCCWTGSGSTCSPLARCPVKWTVGLLRAWTHWFAFHV